MPSIVSEIPETYSSITRPVCVQMIKDIVAYMGLPENTGIDYYGSSEAQFQSSTPTDPTPTNKYPFSGRVAVEVEEEYIEERTLTTAVRKTNEQYVFLDKALGVSIKPIYVRTEVAITFRYRAPDKTSAMKWRDRMRLRVSEGQQELLHEFDYHYPIPKSELLILREIWRLRENQHGYDEDLKTYLRKHFSPRVVSVTNQAGKGALLSMAETQIGVIGWFDFMAQPDKGQHSGEGSPWEIGFEYRFQYDKPVACAMRYPIVIHSQVIGVKYRHEKPIYELANVSRRPNHERRGLDHFTTLYTETVYPFKGIRIPEYDDWEGELRSSKMYDLLTLLIGVDPNSPRELFNIGELGSHEFTPEILEFIRLEHTYLTDPHQSVFTVHLFSGLERMDEKLLNVDSELNITTNFDLDPRRVYHIVISICDLGVLSATAIDRLRKSGIAAIGIIKTLYPNINWTGEDLKLLGGKVLPLKTLQKVVKPATRNSTLKTVGNYSIIVRSKELSNGNP